MGENTCHSDRTPPAHLWGQIPDLHVIFQCPFPGCPRTSCSSTGMCNLFSRLQWGGIIIIFEEPLMPFLHYEWCIQQVPPWILINCHYNSKLFRLLQEHHRRRETLQRCFKANRVVIRVNMEPLEATTAVPYLVRITMLNNSYGTAL